MCPGRRAFGSCLVVAPGSVAHGHHNPGAAVPAPPVVGGLASLVCGVVCSSRAVAAFVLVVWGGIATIGVRHAGDTPSRRFYGRKTPRWALGGAVDGRCCAQRAVHLGRMRRKRGVWVKVDDVVGAVLRCWACAIGPRRRGRRRRCEGWLPASSCPVVVCGGG